MAAEVRGSGSSSVAGGPVGKGDGHLGLERLFCLARPSRALLSGTPVSALGMAELPKDLIHSIPPGIFVGWLVQTFGWLMLHACDLAAGAHSRGEAMV
jgi:hypothetical protein